MTSTLTCARYFDGEVLLGPTRISRDHIGHIISVSSFDGPGKPDFPLVTPGLVDLQVNGYGAIDTPTATREELCALDSELLSLGVTSWLATIVTQGLPQMSHSIESVHHAILAGVPGLKGIHLEGPFLGRAPGAHPVEHIVPIDRAWISALPASVRLLTLAAEQPRVEEAIPDLVQRGIAVSVGHSQPCAAEYERAVRAGASMVTHLFNGMSGVSHRTEPGLALLALTDSRVTAGLIVDLVHANKQAVQLAFAAAGGRVCLVSDCMAWRSPSSIQRGLFKDKDSAVRRHDGLLVGSGVALSDCVRTAVHDCGVELQAALRAATSIPARIAGLDVGHIKEGAACDLVAWTEDLRVRRTWRAGLATERGGGGGGWGEQEQEPPPASDGDEFKSLPPELEQYMARKLVAALQGQGRGSERREEQEEGQAAVMKSAAILKTQIVALAAAAEGTAPAFRRKVHSLLASVVATLGVKEKEKEKEKETLGRAFHAAVLSGALTAASLAAEHERSVSLNVGVFDAIADHHRALAAHMQSGAIPTWEAALASASAGACDPSDSSGLKTQAQPGSGGGGLERYAQAAVSMGEKAWVRRGQDTLENLCLHFFFGQGAEDSLVKREKGRWFATHGCPMPDIAQQQLRAALGPLLPCPASGLDKVSLLDVGSCYNPHAAQARFDVTALDLQPTRRSVYQCDFLSLGVLPHGAALQWVSRLEAGHEIGFCRDADLSQRRLTALPSHSFHALTLSLVLNYLPASEQRIAMLRKARELLVSPPPTDDNDDEGGEDESRKRRRLEGSDKGIAPPHSAGLLLIMEKESILAAGPRRGPLLLRAWKQAICALGFELLTYQLLSTEGRKSHIFAFKTANLPTLMGPTTPALSLPLYCKGDLEALSEEQFDRAMEPFGFETGPASAAASAGRKQQRKGGDTAYGIAR